MFYETGRKRGKDYGTFPTLWKYTYGAKGYGWKKKSSGVYTSPISNRYNSMSWTNAGDIPTAWKDGSKPTTDKDPNWHLIQ